jgi:NAD(P)-dependent dehydrogenase (short-subunit alcohol dehydrogenase family)
MKDKTKLIPDQTQPIPGSEEKMHPQPEVIRSNYRGSDKLTKKVALITGGDSGIGRSVAVHFAREGADISIIYLSEDADALKTKSLVEAEGRQCLIIAGNIQDKKFCDKAVAKTKKKFGSINILVNNAAEQHVSDSLEEMDLSLMEKTFRTNVFGMFFITKLVVPDMKAGDSIINTTSVTSYRGSDHLIDYSSTKGAITAFTRSLSINLADRRIRVNGVAPGPIWTPLIPSTLKNVSDFGKDTPLRRVGQPSEVGPAFVFLASEDASYITGHVIHINGGDFVNT